MNSMMIAWVKYQRRADIMRQYWGYEDKYITSRFKSKFLKPLDYLVKVSLTVYYLLKHRPKTLWMQLPPTFMIFIGLIYRYVHNGKITLIGDFHNSALRPKWFNFPGVRKYISQLDALIVHNEQVKDQLLIKCPDYKNIFVLEDMPFSYSIPAEHKILKRSILFPCSFDIDEPLETVLKAATLTQDITFWVTGNYIDKVDKNVIKNAPSNVNFTGYLSKKDFDNLFWSCEAILGLTTRDDVQLSVSNEALSAEKPMILSNTTTLNMLFGSAAIFVENFDEESIAKGCNDALNNVQLLVSNTKKLKSLRYQRWLGQAEIIKDKID